MLPKQQVLIRSLRVPIAALSRLREVMTYEVERQTPFSIANVYFDVLLTTAPVKGATAADVLLVVAPKASVDAVYQQASSLLPQLRGIDVVDSDGVLLGANLLLPNMRYRPSTRWRAWNMALASILAIALFGTLFGVLQARQRGAGVMEKQAKPVLLTADRIGQRQRELRDLRRVLAQSGSNETTHAQALQLLSDVSALLPEDTYLIQLRLNRPVIAVRGRTHDLPTLLKRLGTSTLWGDPKLTGSRSLEDGQGEEFSLELHVRASVAGRP